LFEFAAVEIEQIALAGEEGEKEFCNKLLNGIFRQKRKWTETEEDEAKVDMDGEEEDHHQQERSPPPSSCSSVENQPQNHQHSQQQLLISSVKEETE
jgi:hypothetical protein